MAGRTSFQTPERTWLRLEKACFGFNAQRDGDRFSFDDPFVLIGFSNKDGHDLELKVDTEGLRFTLVEPSSRVPKMQFSLNEVLRLRPIVGDFDMSRLKMYEDVGFSRSKLIHLVLARDYLLRHLQLALETGFATLHARIGSPLEQSFTQIPSDVFRAFRVIDFETGLAEAPDGSRLFSLHVAPELSGDGALPSTHPQELPPKQASLARYLIANHGGRWPDMQWKPLLNAFSEWTDVQTGERTEIGRSSAADLKKRFPKGFNLDQNPAANFGR